jgi:hypothetical protein
MNLFNNKAGDLYTVLNKGSEDFFREVFDRYNSGSQGRLAN